MKQCPKCGNQCVDQAVQCPKCKTGLDVTVGQSQYNLPPMSHRNTTSGPLKALGDTGLWVLSICLLFVAFAGGGDCRKYFCRNCICSDWLNP